MRKIFSGILAAALMLTLTATAFAAPPDSYSEWAQLYISDAASLDILPDSLKSCDYTQPITRSEFCETAYEAMGYIEGYISFYTALAEANARGESDFLEKNGSELSRIYPAVPDGASPFSDTDSSAVAALGSAGIILGKGSGSFAPDDALTRQEAATILSRVADYFDLQKFSFQSEFSDNSLISEWALKGVNAVCGMGIMVGTSETAFSPSAAFTREQAVAAMIRLVDSVPYLCNKEEISDGLYCIFNNMWMWVEDDARSVLFKLPAYWATYNYRPDCGYSGWDFFDHGGRTLAAVWGKADPSVTDWHTALFDVSTGDTLLDLPSDAGIFYALSPDGSYIITKNLVMGTEPGDWGTTYFGVYGFDGKEILPAEHEWSELYRAGYADTDDYLNYIWR